MAHLRWELSASRTPFGCRVVVQVHHEILDAFLSPVIVKHESSPFVMALSHAWWAKVGHELPIWQSLQVVHAHQMALTVGQRFVMFPAALLAVTEEKRTLDLWGTPKCISKFFLQSAAHRASPDRSGFVDHCTVKPVSAGGLPKVLWTTADKDSKLTTTWCRKIFFNHSAVMGRAFIENVKVCDLFAST